MATFSKPLTNTASSPNKRKITPPIPLHRPEKKELHKGDYQTYKLRNVPTEEKSPTYELSIPYFSSGSCEEWLLFLKNVRKVLVGQNVTTGPASYAVGRRLLDGDALATFNNAATGQNETVATFNECMDAVTKSVFPARAVLLQKRYMRRFLRKPMTMKTREYVARIIELNNYVPLFPPVTGNEAPEKLPDDELTDLLEFGVPNSWQRNMILQDFDPLQHTVKEFVNFCERLEQVELAEGHSPNKKPKAPNGKSDKKRSRGDSHNPKHTAGKADCMLHGTDCGHSTEDCYTLKSQAKKMRQNWEAQTPDKKKSYKKKQELNAIVAEAVETALNAKKSKKRTRKQTEKELTEFKKLSISDTSDTESSEE